MLGAKLGSFFKKKSDMTNDEIANEVHSMLIKRCTDKELSDFFFAPLTEGSLISYHHGLCQYIRNTYGLWKTPWVQELKNGVDHSPQHPDNRSMAIIQDVWKKGLHKGE